MMVMNERLLYKETKDAQLIKLRYKNTTMEALIILPKPGASMKNALNELNLNANLVKEKVTLELPKVKIENTFQLKEVLE